MTARVLPEDQAHLRPGVLARRPTDRCATTAFAAAVNRRAALLSTYYLRFIHGAADLAGIARAALVLTHSGDGCIT
ncbi:MAG: hypothetical protein QOG28_2700 [Trebonia sp.]|nr:hypothetical protein [Trebonia sp.]